MIPKRMFFYWGNKTLSWTRYLTLYSFRKMNPDWEVTLFLTDVEYEETKPWKDSPTQDFHNFTGINYLSKVLDLDINICRYYFTEEEKVAGPSYRSNFFKWKMLAKEAGFYSDLDILYLKPFEQYYSKMKDSNVVICHNGKYFSIGLLGSSGESKFYEDVYDSSLKSYTSRYYQSAGVNSLLHLVRRITLNEESTLEEGFDVFTGRYSDSLFYNLPMIAIYPWTCTKMAKVFNQNHFSHLWEECIGIHWYAGDSIAQWYNNILNEQNYKYFDSTFCSCAREIIEGEDGSISNNNII